MKKVQASDSVWEAYLKVFPSILFAFIMDVRTGIFGVEAAAVTRAATTAIAKMAPCKRLF